MLQDSFECIGGRFDHRVIVKRRVVGRTAVYEPPEHGVVISRMACICHFLFSLLQTILTDQQMNYWNANSE